MRGWLVRRLALRTMRARVGCSVRVLPLCVSCAALSSHTPAAGNDATVASMSTTQAKDGRSSGDGGDDMLELMMQGCGPVASSPAATEAHEGTPSASTSTEEDAAKDHTQELHVLRLHNLPRNWLHEDILTFIDQVAAHAGIAPPPAQDTQAPPPQQEEEEEDSAMPHAHSPFVRRLQIPFGRRTGLVFGTPQLTLTSADLANYLLTDLTFDPDDYRNRIYFTRVKVDREEGEAAAAAAAAHANTSTYYSIEETVEAEQAEALRGLELDRYLLAPDLTLDIAKMHQRRLVTRNERVLLDSFLDGDEDAEAEGDDTEGNDAVKASTGAKKGSRRAGTQHSLGRGSMRNTPIPKPYIEGRRL